MLGSALSQPTNDEKLARKSKQGEKAKQIGKSLLQKCQKDPPVLWLHGLDEKYMARRVRIPQMMITHHTVYTSTNGFGPKGSHSIPLFLFSFLVPF